MGHIGCNALENAPNPNLGCPNRLKIYWFPICFTYCQIVEIHDKSVGEVPNVTRHAPVSHGAKNVSNKHDVG